jgi:hypothetical protein
MIDIVITVIAAPFEGVGDDRCILGNSCIVQAAACTLEVCLPVVQAYSARHIVKIV